MTPTEHYREAEKLLEAAAGEKTYHLVAAQLTARAAVHARLAAIPQAVQPARS